MKKTLAAILVLLGLSLFTSISTTFPAMAAAGDHACDGKANCLCHGNPVCQRNRNASGGSTKTVGDHACDGKRNCSCYGNEACQRNRDNSGGSSAGGRRR